MKKLLIGLLLLFPGVGFAQSSGGGGGSSAPPGSTTQSIYNNAGVFAASPNLLIFDTPIATPSSGPTVTVNGTAGTNLMGYVYAGVDASGLRQGPTSPATVIANSQQTGLNGTNNNTIGTGPVARAASCNVYRQGALQGTPSASQPGFTTYVGNVACGSSIIDQTWSYSVTGSPTGALGNLPFDTFQGATLTGNFLVTGMMAIGNTTAISSTPQFTSSHTALVIGQTVTGFGAASSEPDPTGMYVNQVVLPGFDYAINQAWAAQYQSVIPASNPLRVGAIEGAGFNAIANGSGYLDSGDGFQAAFFIGGSVGPSPGFIGPYTGANLAATSSTTANLPDLEGIHVNTFDYGASGTLAYLADISIDPNASVCCGRTVTQWNEIDIQGTSGAAGVLNFNQLHLGNATGQGSTTNYAIRQDGTGMKSLFQGQVQLASLISVGTKFTTSGCSLTSPVGGTSAGTVTSGTTGTCTFTVTLAGATGATAPNGWHGTIYDLTTTADVLKMTASTATTITFSGTTVSGDVLNFAVPIGF